MLSAHDLVRLPRRELRALAAGARPVEPSSLDDSEWRGTSLGLPRWVERLTWKKFKKVFHRDGPTLRGWNVRVLQNALAEPWITRVRRGRPVGFGHFVVRDAPTGGVLLDYGIEGARLPMRLVRDPLLALGDDLLLGWSDVMVRGRAWPTPTFFALERDVALTHVAHP
jgi:hypothetical protein